MSGQDENNKWQRRQSTQGNSASPSTPSSQNFSNQPRRSVSRSDRSNSSFQQQNNRNFSNSSSGGNNAGGYSAAGMVDDHVPVNGFNAKEVKDYLNKAYQDALNAAQGQGENKPVIYKSNDKGWTTQNKSSPWAPNKHVMANGMDFLTKLKKGVAGTNANGGSKDGKIGG